MPSSIFFISFNAFVLLNIFTCFGLLRKHINFSRKNEYERFMTQIIKFFINIFYFPIYVSIIYNFHHLLRVRLTYRNINDQIKLKYLAKDIIIFLVTDFGIFDFDFYDVKNIFLTNLIKNTKCSATNLYKSCVFFGKFFKFYKFSMLFNI